MPRLIFVVAINAPPEPVFPLSLAVTASISVPANPALPVNVRPLELENVALSAAAWLKMGVADCWACDSATNLFDSTTLFARAKARAKSRSSSRLSSNNKSNTEYLF